MRDEASKSPEALLADLRGDEPPRQSRLKIFLGMCPGVGKTYAMLSGARQLLDEGGKVVVGVAETHGRAEIAALLEGLPSVPPRHVAYQNITLNELDLDGVLALRPEVVLIDELAHSNAPGSRHPKRYQDVLELLDAGISVHSTLNVQHIESRVDVVRQITGIAVTETVPDSILDRADEIQLIDLTPEELRQRLKDGKVYLGDRGQLATERFFRHQNLVALREMSLRLAAEIADQEVREAMRERRIGGPWKAREQLMVAVSDRGDCESLIRWTRRIAGALDCPWIAAHVESDGNQDPVIKEKLTRNLALVRQLGGEAVVTSGKIVSSALVRVAQERNVTQIVMGKPDVSNWWRRFKDKRLIDRLIKESGAIDIYVVEPDHLAQTKLPSRPQDNTSPQFSDFAICAAAVAAVTALSVVVEPVTGYLAVALIYLLLVVVLGARYTQGPVLTAAALSALLWNYLFIPPHFTFYIGKLHDAMIFAMYFVIALVMGHLTGRIRMSELSERRRERRTAALYELAHQAAFAPELDAGLRAAISHIESIFSAKAALVLRLPDHTLAGEAHPVSSFVLTEKEQSVAAWAFSRRVAAGRFTDTLPDAEALHLPLQGRTAVMGVLSIRPTTDHPFDLPERDLLEAFAVLIGLLLEKDHIAAAIKRAEILDASEQLRRSLLDSVSHELKTPLAAVQAGVTALEQRQLGDPEKRLAFDEVRGALRRLNRVINNLLDMTRIEAGSLQAKLEWCGVDELVENAIELAGESLEGCHVEVEVGSDLPMIRIDHALVEQALVNLLVNAAHWSGAGDTIVVRARLDGDVLTLSVLDNGPGIDPKDMAHLFEKFYRGEAARPGGTGLGLSIVDGFIRAHGGSVRATNRAERGAEFQIRLPVEILDERQLESRL